MTQGQGEGKVKLLTMNLVTAGSPLTDGICLSTLLKIRWGVRNTFTLLDCSIPFLSRGGGGEIPCDFGQFYGARGTGSGLTDQWYFGPLHTR